MQPSKFDQSSAAPVQTSEPPKPARPKWLNILIKIFSPLMRLPVFGGLGRTPWLIAAVIALGVFLAGSFWARITPIDAALPARYSWSWWTSSLEFHRELQLASFQDEEIESVAVARIASGKDRVFIAGTNALLAYSDDAGHTWITLKYDPLTAGFAIPGRRAPFPDSSLLLAPAPQTGDGSGNSSPTIPVRRSPAQNPSGSSIPQQNTAPVYQSPVQKPAQKPAAPPVTRKPGAKKSAASLSFLPSFVPSVWAAEKSAGGQSTTATSQDLLQQLRPAGATGATGNLQPQPPPAGILAICRADDGSLVLVMNEQRAAISGDQGETWRATSLDTLIKPTTGGLISFIGGTASTTGKISARLKAWTGRPPRVLLGDTLLYYEMTQVFEPQQFVPDAAYRISSSSVWAISAFPLSKLQTGPAGAGYVDRYYTDTKGSRWLPVITAFPAGLRDVAFSLDATTGYVVGTHGTILVTTNGGASWQPLTREALHPGQASSAETVTGSYWRLPPPWTYPLLILFVGSLAAAIAISAVPGANSLREAANLVSQPPPSPGTLAGVELVSVSDRPLGEDDVDSLGFRGIARGVAGFLRNPKTQLPVTLAINGAWGSGKSSLMNLICGELSRAGFRPVWFNAWHHQEDENLLASLLQSVRAEASPSLLRKGGLAFRLRLGWFRFVRFYPRALAMVAIFIGLWAAESWYENPNNAVNLRQFFVEQFGGTQPVAGSEGKPQNTPAVVQNAPTGTARQSPAPVTPTADSAKPDTGKGAAKNDSPGWFGTLVNFFLALHEGSDDLSKKYDKLPRFFSVLYFIFRILPASLQKLKSFTVNPASLLHTSAPGVPAKKIEEQTSFRILFARQFRDVTQALGENHRLVIFVDDLDRCRPANVAEMMEAINYVSVSGECAFVLGLETEAVRAALGLSFSAMAQELDVKNPLLAGSEAPKAASPAELQEVERKKRADFARRYVEKLINIEMSVPALDRQKKQTFFTIALPAAPASDPFERARKIVKVGRFLEPAVVFLLVLALGWGAGRFLVHLAEWQAQDYYKDKQEQAAAAAPNTAVTISPAPPDATQQLAASPANLSPAATPVGSGKAPEVLPGKDPLPAVMLLNPLMWVVMMLFLTGVIQLLAREPIPPAKDSQEFTRALSAWGLVAGSGLRTPRSTKRFLNRLRFLAMRQIPPAVQLPGLVKLLLTAEQEKEALRLEEARVAGATAKAPIPESILVALAALESYSKAGGNEGLAASAIKGFLVNLGKEAAQATCEGDFQYAPFLAELGRVAASKPSVPEFKDDKSMHDFFKSLTEDGKIRTAADYWAEAAAPKISGHMDAYFHLGGDVVFT